MTKKEMWEGAEIYISGCVCEVCAREPGSASKLEIRGVGVGLAILGMWELPLL
jgi:hypothetical protein